MLYEVRSSYFVVRTSYSVLRRGGQVSFLENIHCTAEGTLNAEGYETLRKHHERVRIFSSVAVLRKRHNLLLNMKNLNFKETAIISATKAIKSTRLHFSQLTNIVTLRVATCSHLLPYCVDR